jgi:hypothetical protein
VESVQLNATASTVGTSFSAPSRLGPDTDMCYYT